QPRSCATWAPTSCAALKPAIGLPATITFCSRIPTRSAWKSVMFRARAFWPRTPSSTLDQITENVPSSPEAPRRKILPPVLLIKKGQSICLGNVVDCVGIEEWIKRHGRPGDGDQGIARGPAVDL